MDKYRLEYEMKTKGVSIEKLCKELGISKCTYYRKVNGTSDFTLKEIQTILKVLNLRSPIGIFFKNDVS